ncbi:MAG: hypothetical protein JETT_1942 [Candidatus Jettenia ecosi]|uniref:Uncharacterized protein n=1 Tax=Candidatus Jettenia ecosi TaxID=2494326 RepID=A0A533QAP6_9BACT|nr:MAG: hypothetical protein JETT_1942 [Candidatus Jettenia ecosi]
MISLHKKVPYNRVNNKLRNYKIQKCNPVLNSLEENVIPY